LPRSRREVERGLLAKGFEQSERDHHFFVYRTVGGLKTTVRTKTSHSVKDIPDGLLSAMARQCHCAPRLRFLNLVDCPLDRAAYEGILRGAGVL